jgi:hypothetical protein
VVEPEAVVSKALDLGGMPDEVVVVDEGGADLASLELPRLEVDAARREEQRVQDGHAKTGQPSTPRSLVVGVVLAGSERIVMVVVVAAAVVVV